ncbi:hypothetical protein D3C86_1262800 [compost metagenome]
MIGHRRPDCQRAPAHDQKQQMMPPGHRTEAPPFIGHRPQGSEADHSAVTDTPFEFDHPAQRQRLGLAPSKRQNKLELFTQEKLVVLSCRVARLNDGDAVQLTSQAIDSFCGWACVRRRPAHEQPDGQQERRDAGSQHPAGSSHIARRRSAPQQTERNDRSRCRQPSSGKGRALQCLVLRLLAMVQKVDLAARIARFVSIWSKVRRTRRRISDLALRLQPTRARLLGSSAGSSLQQVETVEAEDHCNLRGQHHLRLVVLEEVVLRVIRQQHVDVANGVVRLDVALR